MQRETIVIRPERNGWAVLRGGSVEQVFPCRTSALQAAVRSATSITRQGGHVTAMLIDRNAA